MIELHCGDRLDVLKALGAGWDGYGAAPIDPTILDAARWLLGRIPPEHAATVRVVPMMRGRLQFEWITPPRELELEFESPHTIHYLKWQPPLEPVEEILNLAMNLPEILDLIRWCQPFPSLTEVP